MTIKNTISWKDSLFYSVILAAALAVGYVFARSDYNYQGGLLVLLLVILISFLLIRKLGKGESAQWFVPLLIAALGLKVLFALTRMQTYVDVYGGLYDAGRYLRTGGEIAEKIRVLDLGPVLFDLQFHTNWGTRYTEFYSGVVQTFVGPTASGLYIVWAVIGFVGSYFYYRAFCVAFPQGNRLLYALLAFFVPSILFWANGLGKDALMALFIGLASYGIARLFTGEYSKSLLPLILGLFGAFTVRPHMVGLIAIALIAAFAIGGRRHFIKSPIAFPLFAVAALVFVWYMIPLGAKYAGLEDASFESIQEYAEHRHTILKGGAGFNPPSLTNPAEYPMIYATVLVRPFPWEAHNIQALLQSANGMLLVALILWKLPRVLQALKASPNQPFVIFIIVYLLVFGPAFITITNFGTLAREQAMLHPLFLMLVAFQPEPKVKKVSLSGKDNQLPSTAPPPAFAANQPMVSR